MKGVSRIRRIIGNIILIVSLIIVISVLIFGFYQSRRIEKEYEINSYRTVRTINYKIIGTEKINKVEHLPERFVDLHRTLTSTNMSHITRIEGKSGNKYKVKSKKLYNYAKDNEEVTFNIKEKEFEQYQCFEQEVLDIILVDKKN